MGVKTAKVAKTFLYIFIFLSENVLYVHSGILCHLVE